jgi:hypothetical protein
MTQQTRPAWHFEAFPSGLLAAIEPDGTRHEVAPGDLNTLAGVRLLNAMARDLSQPNLKEQTHE